MASETDSAKLVHALLNLASYIDQLQDGPEEIRGVCIYHADAERVREAANLIERQASAPELLEALKECHELLAELSEAEQIDDDDGVIERAGRAITRATIHLEEPPASAPNDAAICPSCNEYTLKVTNSGLAPNELQQELGSAFETMKHAIEHIDNGYIDAGKNALTYSLKRADHFGIGKPNDAAASEVAKAKRILEYADDMRRNCSAHPLAEKWLKEYASLLSVSAPRGEAVLVPRELTHDQAIHLADAWGYTLEETCETYSHILEVTRASPPAAAQPGEFGICDVCGEDFPTHWEKGHCKPAAALSADRNNID